MTATMAGTGTRRRLVERHGLLGGFGKWRLGLENFGETRRRSRSRGRRRSGVDGEIGGGERW